MVGISWRGGSGSSSRKIRDFSSSMLYPADGTRIEKFKFSKGFRMGMVLAGSPLPRWAGNHCSQPLDGWVHQSY